MGRPITVLSRNTLLAQSEAVVALPDALSFEEGAVFPLAVLTATSG